MHDARTPPSTLQTECGGRVADCRIAYRIDGPPPGSGTPITLVLGGISADRRARRGPDDTSDGWWEWAFAPGRALDPATRTILTLDWLGGPGESTGTWQGGCDAEGIPIITVADAAKTVALVLDHLGVVELSSIIGSSFGGCVALQFAAAFPDRVARLVVIGAAESPSPLAAAVRVVQRRIVQQARALGRPAEGVRLARALAVTSYRSDREFDRRFGARPTLGPAGPRFSFEAYLDHQGTTFADRFTADAYIALSRAVDLHRVTPADIRCPTTLVALAGDRVAPPWQIRRLAERLPVGRFEEVDTFTGHDAFLAEPESIAPLLDRILGTAEVAA